MSLKIIIILLINIYIYNSTFLNSKTLEKSMNSTPE